ncbi:hypothetical protein PAEPH01_1799 [Pancytospora epiphaga]|nr:hypothetical protein PAEPH01_1799 [Pancytospora epiphaga]
MSEREENIKSKYMKKQYGEKTILYNRECIIYGTLHIPMKTRRIRIGKAIYIETEDGSVFKTTDILNFEFICHGRLLGVIDNYVICKGSDLSIYNDDRCVKIHFTKENGLFSYYYGNNKSGKETQESIQNIENSPNAIGHRNTDVRKVDPEYMVVYEHLLIVANETNILFIPFDKSKDTHYELPHRITSLKVKKISGINLIIAKYGEKECLYYNNVLVYNGYHSDSKKLKVYNMHLLDKLMFKFCNDKNIATEILRGSISEANIPKMSSSCVRLLHVFESIDSLNALLNNYISENSKMVKNSEKNSKTSVSLRNFSISFANDMSRFIHREYFYENPRSLYDYYKNAKIDIFSADFLSRVYKRMFYYNHGITHSKNPAYKIIYIEQQAVRRMNNIENCKGAGVVKTLSSNNSDYKRGFSAHRAIHKDKRAEEIAEVMIEHSIVVEADANDGDSIRQKFFLMRILGNFGLMVMGLEKYLEIDGKMRFNGKTLDNLLSSEMVFIIGMNYGILTRNAEHMWSNIWNESVFEMGRDFSHALQGILKEEKYQDYIDKLQSTDHRSSSVDYIVLIIAAYHREIKSTGEVSTSCFYAQNQSISLFEDEINIIPPVPILKQEFDTNPACPRLNAIFSSFLPSGESHSPFGFHGNNIKNRCFLIVALGIHNLGSNNVVVFKKLLIEANRFGTDEHLKGESRFYNRAYRRLAAISASLVYNVANPVNLNDSFSRLIINGFSFMGKNIFKTMLKRYDACHLDEIFYSELFLLVNDFATSTQEILKILEGSKEAEINDVESHRMAARLFYLSLLHFHKKNDGFLNKVRSAQVRDVHKHSNSYSEVVESLFLLAEYYEDALATESNAQIMLDFALISLSLILNSTFNLRLLRILRRQILKTKEVGGWTSESVFNEMTKEVVNTYEPGFESIIYYRLCIGIVCCGFGERQLSMKKSIDFKIIIVAFFYTRNKLLYFQPCDILRALVFLATRENKESEENLAVAKRRVERKKDTAKVTRYLVKKLEGLGPADRKFVVDVLSDYYENYHDHRFGTVLDMNFLAKMIGITQ